MVFIVLPPLLLLTFPRKGTETSSALRSSAWCIYYYLHFPVRGRKLHQHTVYPHAHVYYYLHFLVRGRKPCNSVPADRVHVHYYLHFPVRGRKLDSHVFNCLLLYHYLHFPVRGRKPPVSAHSKAGICIITYISPQGDGNVSVHSSVLAIYTRSLFTFPRKGTETLRRRFQKASSVISLFTFPRKGTGRYWILRKAVEYEFSLCE